MIEYEELRANIDRPRKADIFDIDRPDGAFQVS